MRFVDTNVLLYAVSTLPAEAAKAERARRVLAARDLVLSVQVLNEFYVRATRVSRPDTMTHDHAARLVTAFGRHRVQPTALADVQRALALRSRFSISYWDALIVSSATAAGCDEVLTEDLQHGQDLDGVRVVNPFR